MIHKPKKLEWFDSVDTTFYIVVSPMATYFIRLQTSHENDDIGPAFRHIFETSEEPSTKPAEVLKN